jgi:hypothetical protein
VPQEHNQFPPMVKVNHQNKAASSGTWHTMDPVPGKVYVSLDMLLNDKGYTMLTEEGKAHINGLLNFKGWDK